MMVFSFEKASYCVTLALGILIGLGGRANAGSIVQTVVQTVDYNFALHGTTFGYYNKFNPSMGTLLDVVIQCQGNAGVVDPFLFLNSTTVDQTFTGSVSFRLNTDGGSTNVSNSFTLTLKPGQSVGEGASTPYNLSTSYGNNSFWVGTGQLFALQFTVFNGGGLIIVPESQSDNPNITILPYEQGNQFITGVETVTYVYGVPEPSAYMMLGTACLVLLAVRYFLGTRIWP